LWTMSSPEQRTLAARLRSRRHYLRELEGRSVAEVEDMLEAIRLWAEGNRTWSEGVASDARTAFAAIREACRATRTTRERIEILVRERPDDARRALMLLMVAIGNTIPDDDAGEGAAQVAA